MSKPEVLTPPAKRFFIITLFALLAACGGGTDEALNNLNQFPNNNTNDNQTILSGSVGDGPITGATITIKAANGAIMATTISDTNAGYEVSVSDQAAYPYTITATSGTDMVTGTTPDFTMLSVAMGPDDTTVNINPFTTLIVKTAQAMPGGLTAGNLDLANQIITDQLNFGLDLTLVPTPVTTPITADNVASIVKASEVQAEMVRRTRNALLVIGQDIGPDDIMLAISSDMIDGYLDGHGGNDASPLISATANIVSGEVLVEALSNNLKVNGAWATDLIDSAIFGSVPDAIAISGDLPITAEMLAQAEDAISAAQAIAPSTALDDVAAIITGLLPETDPADVEAVLSPDLSNEFTDAAMIVVTSSSSQLETVNSSANNKRKNAPPKVSLIADPATIDYNGTTVLNWTSANAVSCSAVEGWSDTHAISGTATTGPLTSDATFSITCINTTSNTSTRSVTVAVNTPTNLNTAPQANDDAYTISNTSTNINLDILANDIETDLNDSIYIVSVTAPNNGGTVSINNTFDGLIYTPSGSFTGEETFTYSIQDSAGEIANATVNIMVTSIDYTIYVSSSPDRSNPVTLANNTVSGDIYIYTGPATDVTRVSFYLDDPNTTGTPVTVESFAPFDFMTTATGGNGTPFDTTTLTDGQHNVTVSIDLSNSTNKVISADFNVANSGEIVQNTLTLTWSPNKDNISGYIVYYGPTADTATTQVSDIPVNMTGFDSQNPSVQFQSWDDLGLITGDNVCFTLKAYNADGLSEGTPAVCSVI